MDFRGRPEWTRWIDWEQGSSGTDEQSQPSQNLAPSVPAGGNNDQAARSPEEQEQDKLRIEKISELAPICLGYGTASPPERRPNGTFTRSPNGDNLLFMMKESGESPADHCRKLKPEFLEYMSDYLGYRKRLIDRASKVRTKRRISPEDDELNEVQCCDLNQEALNARAYASFSVDATDDPRWVSLAARAFPNGRIPLKGQDAPIGNDPEQDVVVPNVPTRPHANQDNGEPDEDHAASSAKDAPQPPTVEMIQQDWNAGQLKRKRGRPLGSKNKPKVEGEHGKLSAYQKKKAKMAVERLPAQKSPAMERQNGYLDHASRAEVEAAAGAQKNNSSYPQATESGTPDNSDQSGPSNILRPMTNDQRIAQGWGPYFGPTGPTVPAPPVSAVGATDATRPVGPASPAVGSGYQSSSGRSEQSHARISRNSSGFGMPIGQGSRQGPLPAYGSHMSSSGQWEQTYTQTFPNPSEIGMTSTAPGFSQGPLPGYQSNMTWSGQWTHTYTEAPMNPSGIGRQQPMTGQMGQMGGPPSMQPSPREVVPRGVSVQEQRSYRQSYLSPYTPTEFPPPPPRGQYNRSPHG